MDTSDIKEFSEAMKQNDLVACQRNLPVNEKQSFRKIRIFQKSCWRLYFLIISGVFTVSAWKAFFFYLLSDLSVSILSWCRAKDLISLLLPNKYIQNIIKTYIKKYINVFKTTHSRNCGSSAPCNTQTFLYYFHIISDWNTVPDWLYLTYSSLAAEILIGMCLHTCDAL